jgi:hypothetical protein
VAVVGVVVAAAGPAQAGERHAALQSATVTITDSTLVVSRASMLSGVTRFVAVNKGRKPHGLAIAGPSVSSRTAQVAAGRTVRLTVILHGGTYTLWDPFGLGKCRRRRRSPASSRRRASSARTTRATTTSTTSSAEA